MAETSENGSEGTGGAGLLGLGFALLLVGALLLLVSCAANSDAKNPRCDGQRLSSGDTCVSTKSGAQSYHDRASTAETAAGWTRPIGIVLALGGLVAAVGGLVSTARS
ncbi:hypothetical protein GFY24_07615 [Nocardia sp. SYP-A9097]|uniref:hypothetical protein n=1 Tax=Nocardia sp. SYP-A9097 TaxID=2663237 RepID=UPI00129A31ED|nr:hypothetical protein [Nocardia sp. SYP-A9097]MRH87330.1 hypothetical protein [Nocardia sp. SYP-A9097]